MSLRVRRISPRPTFLRPTLARLEKAKKKLKKESQRENIETIIIKEIFPRSCAMTVIKRAIMSSTAPS